MRIAILALAIAALSGCGYHVAGTGALPKGIRTIAVPPFTSVSDQYGLADQLAEAVSREFATRTPYEIAAPGAQADAVLTGNIGNVSFFPTVSDPHTGRTTSIGMAIILSVKLVQSGTGKVLYSRMNFMVRDYFENSADPHQTYVANGPALDRLSRTVARDVVASVVDNF